DPKKAQNFVGNVWYGSKGFVVCPNYSSGVAYDNDGEVIQTFDKGGDHFGNFVKAVRSRKASHLNADILEGHLSSALCHLRHISHGVGKEEEPDKKPTAFGVKAAEDAMKDMAAHLKENKIEVSGLKDSLGRKLTLDPKTERFIDDKEANAML